MTGRDPTHLERISALRAYCLKKAGVEETSSYGRHNPSFLLIRGSGCTDFATFRLADDPALLLARCPDVALEAFAARCRGIRRSGRMQWDTHGWTWAEAP